MQQHEQHDTDRRDEEAERDDLLAGQQLKAGCEAEQQPEQIRRAALANEDLIEQQQRQGRVDGEAHVGMSAGLREHERAEAVEQTADGRSRLALHVTPEHEVRAPGREGQRQRDENVVREDGAGEQRHRSQHERGEEHRRVPHQVEPVRVVQEVAVERVVPVGEGERQPAQVPDEERRIRVAADPVVRRRGPGVREDGECEREKGEQGDGRWRQQAWQGARHEAWEYHAGARSCVSSMPPWLAQRAERSGSTGSRSTTAATATSSRRSAITTRATSARRRS